VLVATVRELNSMTIAEVQDTPVEIVQGYTDAILRVDQRTLHRWRCYLRTSRSSGWVTGIKKI
jgi:hypothetical protein